MPVILVSAAFMPQHVFFQWWGGFFRSMLRYYDTIFVQDAYNRQLLVEIGIEDEVLVAGDTRYDRVVSIASSVTSIPEVERFRQDHFLLVAGSTWPEDERLLKELLPMLPQNWKFILAPHEVQTDHINELEKLFEGSCILYSSIEEASNIADVRVLIIDNIGMLSRLYAYGDFAYVGGGFRKRGLHNILEPAAFGLPVLIGPEYDNFVEAIRFIQEKYAYAVTSARQAEERIRELTSDAARWNECRGAIRTFMQQHTGAAEKVIQHIETKGWLRQ
jgi:3-deoxy-D-manno-octulosonic-acid transferase